MITGVGCQDGVKRHAVSGAVTFGGQPVPVGEISFEPDSAKGNKGPGSVTKIRAGRYQTEPGLGVMGGAYIVRITPFDGKPVGDSFDGMPLVSAPHVVHVDLPTEATTQDFDVPAKKKK
jgi:hypothetical protein